jgi:predicted enzyme related to lactoylglutathione lyase
MQNQFFRYELRTTDVPAARRFYADVFGPQFWGADLSASALPERAVALGAPPHWLGHIGVSDVAAAARRSMESGGQSLGPIEEYPDGSVCAVFRDPFGAFALYQYR